MRTDWRWRRAYSTANSMQMALLGGVGTILAILAIFGVAAALALSGAL